MQTYLYDAVDGIALTLLLLQIAQRLGAEYLPFAQHTHDVPRVRVLLEMHEHFVHEQVDVLAPLVSADEKRPERKQHAERLVRACGNDAAQHVGVQEASLVLLLLTADCTACLGRRLAQCH